VATVECDAALSADSALSSSAAMSWGLVTYIVATSGFVSPEFGKIYHPPRSTNVSARVVLPSPRVVPSTPATPNYGVRAGAGRAPTAPTVSTPYRSRG